MATVEKLRRSVHQLMKTYADRRVTNADIETQFLADKENDHYQLVNVGWENGRRIYGCVLHIDIKGDKVWIQHNNTENYVAEELVDLGVPKENIVLGFYSPFSRQFTGFAVN